MNKNNKAKKEIEKEEEEEEEEEGEGAKSRRRRGHVDYNGKEKTPERSVSSLMRCPRGCGFHGFETFARASSFKR
ncbi:Hypothetical predicted protein [Octopus vulgaris]|uniref:Uncharacterized protein n=1 Tax=Octopus vulgaris TaxID=6645 RepID=A0AA36BFC8_OCTVU|nr:Hypothetical predicted protein [Octopus vulgaris]